MREEDKNLLERKRRKLVENIEVDKSSLYACLRSHGLIDRREEENIRESGTNDRQVEVLLDLLIRKYDRALDTFCSCLVESNQKHVVDDILRRDERENNWSESDSPKCKRRCYDSTNSEQPSTSQGNVTVGANVVATGKSIVNIGSITIGSPEEGQSEQAIPNMKPGAGTSVERDSRQSISTTYSEQIKEIAEEPQYNYGDKLTEWYKPIFGDENNYIPGIVEIDKESTNLCIEYPKNEIMKKAPITMLVPKMKKGARMIICADAGYGKSALQNFLCRLWMNSNELMEHYQLVLYGLMKHVRDETLSVMVVKNFKILSQCSYDRLKSILANKAKAKHVLWLLDSYEELNPAWRDKSEIIDLIKGKLYPESSVIITTRPHSDIKEELKQCTEKHGLFHLKKFSRADIQKYISTLSSNVISVQSSGDYSPSEDMAGGIFPSVPLDLLSVPLFLAFVCRLGSTKNYDFTMINTRTKLLNKFLNMLLQTYCQKDLKLKNTVLKFQRNPIEKSVTSRIRRGLIDLGQLCYQAVKSFKRQLDPEDIDSALIEPDEIIELGIGEVTACGQITFCHALLQEYIAALYVISSSETENSFCGDLKKEMRSSSNGNLHYAFGRFWQISLFSVGMKPEFLTSMHALIKSRGICNGGNCIDLNKEIQLYQECSSEIECQQFVELLSQSSLQAHGSPMPLNTVEKPNILFQQLAECGAVQKWGEEMGMCKRESGRVILHNKAARLEGAVMGYLLDIADEILCETQFIVKFCHVNLQHVHKLKRNLSQVIFEKCDIICPQEYNDSIKKSYISSLEMKDCHILAIKNFIHYFGSLETIIFQKMEDIFSSSNQARFHSVKEVIIQFIQTGGYVDPRRVAYMFPDLRKLELENVMLSAQEDISQEDVNLGGKAGPPILQLTWLSIERCYANPSEPSLIECFPETENLFIHHTHDILKGAAFENKFCLTKTIDIENCGKVDLGLLNQGFPCLTKVRVAHSTLVDSIEQHISHCGLQAGLDLKIEYCYGDSIMLLRFFRELTRLTVSDTKNLFSGGMIPNGLPHVQELCIRRCGDVNVSVIAHSFPGLCKLYLENQRLVYFTLTRERTVNGLCESFMPVTFNCTDALVGLDVTANGCYGESLDLLNPLIQLQKLTIHGSWTLFSHRLSRTVFSKATKLYIDHFSELTVGIIAQSFPVLKVLILAHVKLVWNEQASLPGVTTLCLAELKDIPPLRKLCPNLNTLIICLCGRDPNKDLTVSDLEQFITGYHNNLHLIVRCLRQSKWLTIIDCTTVKPIYNVVLVSMDKTPGEDEAYVLDTVFPSAHHTCLTTPEMTTLLEYLEVPSNVPWCG